MNKLSYSYCKWLCASLCLLHLHSEYFEPDDNQYVHMIPSTRGQENEALLSPSISSVSTIEGRWRKGESDYFLTKDHQLHKLYSDFQEQQLCILTISILIIHIHLSTHITWISSKCDFWMPIWSVNNCLLIHKKCLNAKTNIKKRNFRVSPMMTFSVSLFKLQRAWSSCPLKMWA